MSPFCEPVHHHTDGIVPLRFRQLCNQVDADDLPGLRGDVMGVKRVVRALPDGFGSLAFLTSIDVLPCPCGSLATSSYE